MADQPEPQPGAGPTRDLTRGEALSATFEQPFVNRLRAGLAVALTCGSLAWSASLNRTVGLQVLDEQIMGPMLGIALALTYIVFPARRGSRRSVVPWYDWIAALLGLAAGWYIGFTFDTLVERMFERPPDALAVAAVLFVLCLEGLRRATGWALLSVVLAFSAYSQVGHLVPGDLQTRQVDLQRLLIYSAIDTSALFGFILKVALSIVVTFVFFGQVLMKAGGGQFFNDLALALMGRYRGGSAKISIAASSLFGSISGVVVSNIVATGVVTIPLMKRNGFKPRFAAAVEACASTGGQLMPPVMGATAFLMADFLSRPYKDIVVAALVPSLLYYVALFIQADLEAARQGIKRVEESLIPQLLQVLRNGWPFLLPFAVLVYTLFALNWLVQLSAIAASLSILVFGICIGFGEDRLLPRLLKFIGYGAGFLALYNWLGSLGWAAENAMLAASLVLVVIGKLARTASDPLPLRTVYDALHDTGTSVLDLFMIAAGASFIVGILLVTGLGFAITLLLVAVGGANLVFLLLAAGALCIVLGMGMPTIAVYILLAALVAPSMIELGVQPIAAHMFVMYLGMMSFLTPPVAIAAFFAASMAGSQPFATSLTAMRFSWTAYVVPFLFVFSPSLLLQGDSALDLGLAIASAVGGVWLISAGMVGYFTRSLGPAGRLLFLAAGALLLIPHEIAPWAIWTDAAGAVLGVLVAGYEIIGVRAGGRPLVRW